MSVAEYRKRGLVWIVAGIALGGALFVLLIVLSRLGVIRPRVTEYAIGGVAVRETSYPKIWGMPAVVPLFTTLIGAIQLVTGRSLKQLGRAYETMSGGRRLVVSVLVVALALAAIATFVAIALAIML